MKSLKRKVSFSVAPTSKLAEYSRRKNEWIQKNGWVSQAEYDAMIKRLCDELGL